jgi:hypothetical protein
VQLQGRICSGSEALVVVEAGYSIVIEICEGKMKNVSVVLIVETEVG